MREPIHRVAALVGEGADVAVERVEVVDHEVILQRLGDLRHRRNLPRQDGEKRIRPQLHVVPLNADDAVPLADVEEAGLLMDQRRGRRLDGLVVERAQLAPVETGAFKGLHRGKVFHIGHLIRPAPDGAGLPLCVVSVYSIPQRRPIWQVPESSQGSGAAKGAPRKFAVKYKKNS